MFRRASLPTGVLGDVTRVTRVPLQRRVHHWTARKSWVLCTSQDISQEFFLMNFYHLNHAAFTRAGKGKQFWQGSPWTSFAAANNKPYILN